MKFQVVPVVLSFDGAFLFPLSWSQESSLTQFATNRSSPYKVSIAV